MSKIMFSISFSLLCSSSSLRLLLKRGPREQSYARYLPEDACHGDLVVIGAKRLRSSNVYIVHKQPTSGADSAMRLIYGQLSMPTTTASSTTTTTKTAPTSKSNQCCVPLEVSMHMSDPLAFYADAFHFATYDDVDFLGIELDPLLHGERVVSRFTHLPVAANRRLVYLLDNNEWDSRAGLFIWCDFYLDDFAAGRFVRLDERTDGELVTARPRMQRDPHIVAEYAATKHAYEQDFTGMLLAMRPGTEVDVYGLSFFCQKLPKHKHEEEEEEKATTSQERKNKDSDGENDDDDDDDDDEEGSNNGSIFVMVFNRVEWEETSDEPAAIVLNKLEYETVSVNEMSKVLDTNEEFVFVRKVLTPYGKFGNVRLWCAEHVSVIANEKARTYVICSADLFM